MIMMNYCYFQSIVQCIGVLRNVYVYCAMSKVNIDPYKINFDSIAQLINVLRNVQVYCAMSEVKGDPYEMNPNAEFVHNMNKHMLNHAEILTTRTRTGTRTRNLYKP